MRTTLDIPEEIIAEAMRLSGARSKTSTIIISLQEFINRKKIDKLRSLRGRLDLEVNLDELRKDRTA